MLFSHAKLAIFLGASFGLACAAQGAASQVLTLSQPTLLSHGDAVQGAMPLSQKIHLTVVLKLRDSAQLQAFNSRAHAPMNRARLVANHLPTVEQAQAVVSYLRAAGFRNIKVLPDRMLVTAEGNAATAMRAFRTHLARVRVHDGRLAFANTTPISIPARLQRMVLAVLGLQTVHRAHLFSSGIQARATGSVHGHDPLDFPVIYGASQLAPATSMDVAIWGWGSMAQSVADLGGFSAAHSLPRVNSNVICTDVGSSNDPNTGAVVGGGTTTTGDPTCGGNSDQGSDEWSMDSQVVIGMSGGVKSLTFYAAPTPYNSDATDALNEIVSPSVGEPLASVINASFGECERAMDANQGGDGSAQADDALLQIGLAQGQTFSVSTGDFGADECGDGASNSAAYPASSPYVVAMGGTTLNVSGSSYVRETVWTRAGGSPSSFEPRPSWQAGFVPGDTRGVPDLAFDANPNSGALVVVKGTTVQEGGTSLAAPLFTGAWARLLANDDVQPANAAQQLYAMPFTALHDVTGGNNRWLKPVGYFAAPGWDYASGLGSLNLSAFSPGT